VPLCIAVHSGTHLPFDSLKLPPETSHSQRNHPRPVTPPLPFVGGVRQQKSMPDKPPCTGFFIATHHPECQAWSLRVQFFYPHPACQAARGRATLLLSSPPATLPIRAKMASCAICEGAKGEC